MKIALGQVNLTIGDLNRNKEKIIEQIKEAIIKGCDLIVLPELCDVVKESSDLLLIKEYIEKAQCLKDELLTYSDKITILMGAIEKIDCEFFNAAFLLRNKKIEKVAVKNNLNCSEKRYFSSKNYNRLFDLNGLNLLVVIGEDIVETDDADWIIRLNSLPFEKSKSLAYEKSKNTLFLNHVGLAQEKIYYGGSYAVNSFGKLVSTAKTFEEDLIVIDTENLQKSDFEKKCKEEMIFRALSFGFKEFCRINKFKKALIGLSGGIDSAISAVIMCDALGPENVLGITMPSKYSTESSWNDSYELAKNLGMECKTQSIKPLFDTFINEVQGKLYMDLSEENLQARLRGNILMSYSNRENRVLVSTGNKSEASVGYCTLYGDTCGGINLICDLFKQEVYAVSRWINRDKEIIPENTITKAPSAELRPEQKDQDSLPEYEILDEILARYIEEGQSVTEISKDFEENLVVDIINKLNIMEFKRAQFTQILKVSKKSLVDRNYPSINAFRY